MAPVLMEVTIPDEKGGEPLVFLGRLGFVKLSDASRYSLPHATPPPPPPPPASDNERCTAASSSSSTSDTSSDPSFGLSPPCRGLAADADAATNDDGDASSSGDCCSALDDDDDDCAAATAAAAAPPRVYLQRTSSDCAEAPGSLFAGWLGGGSGGGGGASEDCPGSPGSYVSAVTDAVRGAVATTAGWVAGSVNNALRGADADAEADADDGDGLMQLLAEARALPSSPPGAAALLRDAVDARRGVRRLEDAERAATLARCEAGAAAVAAAAAAEDAARAAVEAAEERARAELAGLHASLTRRLLRRRGAAAAAAAGGYPLLPTGDGPCHIAVSPAGSTVAVAEYDAGAVSVFAASAQSAAAARVRASLRGEGCTPGEGRQDAAHPHSTLFLSEDAFVVCDLGADTVEVFKRGASGGWASACVFDILAEVGAAQGARHCAASACGRRLYVVCELSNAVLVLALSEEHTSLALVGTLSTLTEESVCSPGEKPFPFYTAASHAAGVALCHDSNTLYVTNRGADYVAVFELDARTGLPVRDGGVAAGEREVYPVATIPTGGRLPWELSVRHDAATGRSLVAVANQFGGTVADDGCVTVSSYSHKDKTAALVSKHPAKLAMFCTFV
eukprot:Rhum_TRINITY_DN14894_c10_g2::Rhum_TRINITY_DN14894_c10_g2_i1::g.126088::m.126088